MKNKFFLLGALFLIGAIMWFMFGGKFNITDNFMPNRQGTRIIDDVNHEEKWKLYENKDVGIFFQYPDIFKSVNAQLINGEEGRKFIGTLELDEDTRISFGGITENYTSPKGGSIMDTLGYEKRGDDYFIKFAWGNNQVVPSEFLPVNNRTGQAILVRGTDIEHVLSRETVAVFLNIPNSIFRGVVFEITPSRFGEPVSEKHVEILRGIISSVQFGSLK